MTLRYVLILLFMMVGCTTSKVASPTSAPDRAQSASGISSSAQVNRASQNTGVDRTGPTRMRLDVFHLTVPQGTISRNEEFWKRINEQTIDVASYDLLFKNGVRVGEAPISEWEYFKSMMEDHPATYKTSTLLGNEAKDVDLEVRKEMPTQTIFYLDESNQLHGRTYDRCENYIALSYQPAPRKRDVVRIALCPVVKSIRKRLEYAASNREIEVSYRNPERLYDINLRVDVPLDSFLVVAPSVESSWPSSIGSSFLLSDGAAERMESVLLLIPRKAGAVE